MPSPHQISIVTMPAASLALVSLDVAKDALRVTVDTKDGLIGRQIAQVSAAINTYCNRVFVRQSYRDQFRYSTNWLGFGSPLVLVHSPVAVDADGDLVLTVDEDGALVGTTEWSVDRSSGALYRLDSAGGFAAWSGALVTVNYDAGFDIIPDDVQAAALEWLTARWNSYGRDPALRSLNIPDVVSETYFDPGATSGAIVGGVPVGVKRTLDQYRVWAL
jgi:hypothetical protein